MNPNDHNPDLSTLIDPELEARVVAWVSGEASPFEDAELTRLTGEKPELAIFQRRIAAVSGLLGETIRPDAEPRRLAPERRAKLLQALGATENKPNPASTTHTVVLPLAAKKKTQRKIQRWIYGLAACLTVGLFTLLSIPTFQRARDADRMSYKSDDSNRRLKEAKVSLPMSTALAQDEIAGDASLQSRGMPERRERDLKARGFSSEGKLKRETQKQQIARPGDLAKAGVASPSPRQMVATTGAGGEKQIAAPAINEEQLVLSPFVVEAKKDSGYSAKDTLAGTRLRTDLKDISSSITVVTKEFLKEIAATNNETTLQYTTGTEVAGSKDVFGDSRANSPVANGFIQEKKTDDRTRGLSAEADASKPDEEQTVVLSPFEVTAEVKSKEANNTDLPPPPRPAQSPIQTFSEISAAKEPVSTFSLHVSDVSFRLAQVAIAQDEAMDPASIRPEEFYNAFSYGDPTPALAEKVSCRIEQAAHPFIQQRNLVRIAVKVAAAGRDAAQPLHLTVLLDTSGSMEREDRAATIHSAMSSLISLLGANDRLTLIGFSRQPRLLAESLPGDQAAQVLELIAHTPAEGGTNLEEALKLGSELAHRQFNPAAQNRIVLLTDGAANLGNANPAQLAATIEALRQQKIAFDACGVGLEGLDDGMLENLTRKGDGRYYVLNSPEAADAGFAKQLAGAFRPAAENVKLQVRFNPARVGNYRLIGFEKHRLNEEDFRNDKVDAAELAAEEAAVAVYQVEALPQGEGELGEVYVRFRDTASGQMVERSWTLNYDAQAPAFDRATPSIQLAGVAALLAENLQGGEAGNAIVLGDLAPVVAKLRHHYAHEERVQELVTMFEQVRKLGGE